MTGASPLAETDDAGGRLAAAARRLASWTREELAREAGASYPVAHAWVERQIRQGLVERARGPGETRFARVAAGGGATGSPHEHMWAAMRRLPSFTAGELAAIASTEAVVIGEALAGPYCRALARAGYLRAVRKAVPGVRPASYRLVRNTGPMAPVERRVSGIHDANTQEFILAKGAGLVPVAR